MFTYIHIYDIVLVSIYCFTDIFIYVFISFFVIHVYIYICVCVCVREFGHKCIHRLKNIDSIFGDTATISHHMQVDIHQISPVSFFSHIFLIISP